jgi:hypothetical protein
MRLPGNRQVLLFNESLEDSRKAEERYLPEYGFPGSFARFSVRKDIMLARTCKMAKCMTNTNK